MEVSLNDEDGKQVIPDGTVYCIRSSFTDHPEWVEELRVTPERSDTFSVFSLGCLNTTIYLKNTTLHVLSIYT